MNDIIFSFVVPVYNVSEYLARCAESLCEQKFDKELYEVIFIDDGSTDNSGMLCDEIAKNYSNFFVFHKSNGGLSDARNYGVSKAKGKYVIFLDSDDFVVLETCKLFSEALANLNILPDVIVAEGIKIGNDMEKWGHHESSGVMTGYEFLKKELLGKFEVSACVSIYNRQFLISNRLLFKKGILHEDFEFTPRVFLNAKYVLCTNICFYNYVTREESIMHKKNMAKNGEHVFQIARELEELYNKIEDEELKLMLKSYSAKMCLRCIEKFALYKKKNRNIIDLPLIERQSFYFKEKFRVTLLKIHPLLFHVMQKLRYKINI